MHSVELNLFSREDLAKKKFPKKFVPLMSKRTAGKQLTKDSAGHSDHSGSGTDSEVAKKREKAPEEVIASRKIVSVRRGGSGQVAPQQKPATPPLEEQVSEASTSKTNGLFGGLSGLCAQPTISAAETSPKRSLFSGLCGLAKIPEEMTSGKTEVVNGDKGPTSPGEESTNPGLFSSLFSGKPDTLFSSSGFSFAPSDSNLFGASVGLEQSFPAFGQDPTDSRQSPEEESSEEEVVEPLSVQQDHEEETETLAFQADCKLYKLQMEEEEGGGSCFKWTEKGIGFVRLVQNKENKLMRLVVRMKGVFRLLLSTGLVSGLAKAERVGNKSVRFAGLDGDAVAQFRLNLLTEDQQTAFLEALLPGLKL